MSKVVYILPQYDEWTDTHFYYNYELINNLAGRLDIFVVIEKAVGEIKLNASHEVQKNQRGFFRFCEIFSILRRLRREGYDNFYVHYSYYGALAAWLVARFYGGKVFYWNRGMPWLFERNLWEERIFGFILRSTILVTSPESLAKEYQKRYGVKEYKLLSNWIDTERFRPREDKMAMKRWFGVEGDTKIILFVHHLSERKGADLVAKIAEKLSDLPVVFFVVGDGPHRGKLEAESVFSAAPIRLLGAVPNRNMVPYFQAADVYLMPSREEGSPHTLLDAMAAGTPFVASDIGGVREIAPPGFRDFLCPPEDVSCFADEIKKLLLDSGLYETLRQEGLEFVKNFDRERGISEFVSLFR